MSTQPPMITNAQWAEVSDLFAQASKLHRITISTMIWICTHRKVWPELPRQYGPWAKSARQGASAQ